MIRDVDDSIVAWLAALVPRTEISVGPPTDAAGPGSKRGSLALFLHEVREDADGSASGWSELRNDDGVLVGRVPPTRRYRLTYLISAHAADARAEHELLGRVLAGAALHEVVPGEHLVGSLADAEATLVVRCAPARGRADPRELWAAWRIPPRTTLELSVLSPLPIGYVAEVAEPPSAIDLFSGRPPVPGPDAAARPAPARPTRRIHEG